MEVRLFGYSFSQSFAPRAVMYVMDKEDKILYIHTRKVVFALPQLISTDTGEGGGCHQMRTSHL